MGFSFKNIKTNWQKTQQDPYFSTKFTYKMQRIFVYFIMAVIGVTFINLIWNFKSSSSMGLLVRLFMVVIGIYLLYQIYAKTLLPTKKILQHYENSPTPIASTAVNVGQEIDDLLNQFDADGKKIHPENKLENKSESETNVEMKAAMKTENDK